MGSFQVEVEQFVPEKLPGPKKEAGVSSSPIIYRGRTVELRGCIIIPGGFLHHSSFIARLGIAV